LIAILALGALLRFHKLGAQSLWDDEISTIDYTRQTIAAMWADLPVRDANPPLFYIVFHFWREVGTSEAAYRALPAFFGVVALLLAFAVAHALAGPRVALLATLLLAVNPLSIYCAQETRAHTILLTLCLASFWFYIRLMEHGRARDALGWAIVTAAAAYTHYFAAFVVLTQVVHASATGVAGVRGAARMKADALRATHLAIATRSVAVRGSALLADAALAAAAWMAVRRVLYFAGALVLVGTLYLPWAKAFLLQIVRGQSWRPYTPPWELLADVWIYATVGHSATRYPVFLPSLGDLQDGAPGDVLRFTLALLALLVPFLALAVAGARAWRRQAHGGRLLVLLWALLPPALLTAVTQKVNLYDYRHILPFVPPLAILIAAALDRLAARSFAVFLLAAGYVTALPIVSLAQYYDDPAFAKQDWRGAYGLIREQARPGDVILTYHPSKALGLLYYADGSIPFAYVVPGDYTGRTIEEETAAVAARVGEVAASHPRVWLVDYHGLVFDRTDVARRVLRERMTLAAERAFLKGPRRYTIELYTADFAEAARAFVDHVDFEEGDHAPGQVLSGWHQAARRARWMAERGEVVLRNAPGAAVVRATFYAYTPFLGKKPFDVRLEVEGTPVGAVRVDREGFFTVTGALPDAARDREFVRVALASGAWFRPADYFAVPDTTHKSLLVTRIALEAR
jgi:uncharacterized membrane protein